MLAATIIIGLTSVGGQLWQRRKILSELAIALLLSGFPFLLVAPIALPTQIILVLVQIWLLVLGFRLIFGRLDGLFLQTSTRLNVFIAAGILLLMLVGLLLFAPGGAQMFYEPLLFVVLTASLVISSIFLWQSFWTLKHYKLRKIDNNLRLKDLPTVTLAIPARNETHALTDCLSAAVASDYPKLEIIVLDDCSQDNTSALIRAFAQSGVRFISGKQPALGWLGKNQALRTLVENASGEYIVFADVDTKLSSQSISKLVAYALSNKAEMVSVLPMRRDGLCLATSLWQLRYYWQIVLPITKKRVPVAGQCWLIKTAVLSRFGGIKAVKHKIVPEGTFARRLFATDLYRFLISNNELGVTTAKKWSSQNETAIRFLYPTFKRQPLFVLIGCIMLFAFVALPMILISVCVFFGWFNLYFAMSVVASVLLVLSYVLVVVRAVPRVWLLTMLMFPFSIAQEFVLLIGSMILYEFGDVNWKGRNVCYPVIEATASKLPNIK